MSYNWDETNTINNSFSQLWNNEFLSDIVIEFMNGKSLHAHLMVLSLRSREIYNSIQENSNKSNQEIISTLFEDYSFDLTQQFLKFLYTDDCDINSENVFDLLDIAMKFKINALIKLCSSHIDTKLHILEILDFSMNINIDDSDADKWIEKISYDFENTLNHPKFPQIKEQTLIRILQLDSVSHPNEFFIFGCVMNWVINNSNMNASDEQFTGDIKRNILGNSLKLIRFAAMTNEEFSKCIIKEPGLLTYEEITEIFINISCGIKNSFGFSDTPRNLLKTCNQAIDLSRSLTKSNKINDSESSFDSLKSSLPYSPNSIKTISPTHNIIPNGIIYFKMNRYKKLLDFSFSFKVSEPVELRGIEIKGIPRRVRMRIQSLNINKKLSSNYQESQYLKYLQIAPFIINADETYEIKNTFLDSANTLQLGAIRNLQTDCFVTMKSNDKRQIHIILLPL